jgi:uncharacterized protein YndB with AHSA1/START domain
MEYESIEREIHVDASPEVVFEVVSRPEHLREWWPDEADFEPSVGAAGHITFRGATPGEENVVSFMVVEIEPPHRFSFRWDYAPGAVPGPGDSMLVTFNLEPSGDGTRVLMTETGFRERGWEAAVLEKNYQEHVQGWNYYVPRLGDYVARFVSSS